MSTNDLQAEIARLQAENARLHAEKEASKNAPLTCKVSEKGAVSVYGMGRFPITLYRGQMERLLNNSDKIRQFIRDNSDKLITKD